MAKTATIWDHKKGLTAEELLLTGTGGQVQITYSTDEIEVNREMVDTVEEAEIKKAEWES